MTIILTLLSVIGVSLVAFIGILGLAFNKDFLHKSIFVLVSVAVGALLGDAFVHLIPEAFETIDNHVVLSLTFIAGILFFFILEKALHWYHHDPEGEDTHAHPVGKVILIGDGAHNLIDGMLIAASYQVSIEVGIATTVAVILHEIPHEIGNFGALIHSGYSAMKALWYNFISALTSVVGAILVLLFGNVFDRLSYWLLPLTAGSFIYIALSDLIPELHKERRITQSIIQVISIIAGVGAMVALLGLE